MRCGSTFYGHKLLINKMLIVLIVFYIFLLNIATLAFGIQALIVGTNLVSCQNSYTLNVWFLVFGSFAIGVFILNCSCNVTLSNPEQNKKEKEKEKTPLQRFTQLVDSFIFAWLCYGMYLVFHPPQGYPECATSDWNVFSFMIHFMLWSRVAVYGIMCLLMCVGCCVVVETTTTSSTQGPTTTTTNFSSATNSTTTNQAFAMNLV